MSDTVDTLILDLLEWMGPEPRPYAVVIEAWRTSCPRFPVWEDANDRGFIARHRVAGRGGLVSVSAAGAAHLRKHRQPSLALTAQGDETPALSHNEGVQHEQLARPAWPRATIPDCRSQRAE